MPCSPTAVYLCSDPLVRVRARAQKCPRYQVSSLPNEARNDVRGCDVAEVCPCAGSTDRLGEPHHHQRTPNAQHVTGQRQARRIAPGVDKSTLWGAGYIRSAEDLGTGEETGRWAHQEVSSLSRCMDVRLETSMRLLMRHLG